MSFGRCRVRELAGEDVHAIAGLLRVHFHLVAWRGWRSPSLPALVQARHGDRAVRIVDGDDRMRFHLEMLFDLVGRSAAERAEKQQAGNRARRPTSNSTDAIAQELGAGCSLAVVSAFRHLREQIRFLLIRFVQIIARDFVLGFFAHAFFTQSDVVVNDGEVLVQGSSHHRVGCWRWRKSSLARRSRAARSAAWSNVCVPFDPALLSLTR